MLKHGLSFGTGEPPPLKGFFDRKAPGCNPLWSRGFIIDGASHHIVGPRGDTGATSAVDTFLHACARRHAPPPAFRTYADFTTINDREHCIMKSLISLAILTAACSLSGVAFAADNADAKAAYADIEATFGSVPTFLKVFPPEGIAGAWSEMKSLQLNPHTALRSEEHTSELQSRQYLVCRLLLEKKKNSQML